MGYFREWMLLAWSQVLFEDQERKATARARDQIRILGIQTRSKSFKGCSEVLGVETTRIPGSHNLGMRFERLCIFRNPSRTIRTFEAPTWVKPD